MRWKTGWAALWKFPALLLFEHKLEFLNLKRKMHRSSIVRIVELGIISSKGDFPLFVVWFQAKILLFQYLNFCGSLAINFFIKRSLLIDLLSTLPQQYWHIMKRNHFTGRKLLWNWMTTLYSQRTYRTDFPSLIENQGQNQTIIRSSKNCK